MLSVNRLGKYVKICIGSEIIYARRVVNVEGRDVVKVVEVLGKPLHTCSTSGKEVYVRSIVADVMYGGINRVDLMRTLSKVDNLDYVEMCNDLKQVARLEYLLESTLDTHELETDYLTHHTNIPKKLVQLCGKRIDKQTGNHTYARRSRTIGDCMVAELAGMSLILNRLKRSPLETEVRDNEILDYYLNGKSRYIVFRDQKNIKYKQLYKQSSVIQLLRYTPKYIQLYYELYRLNESHNDWRCYNTIEYYVRICNKFKCTPKLLVDTWGWESSRWVRECILTYVPVFKERLKTLSITDKDSIEYIGRLSLLAKGVFGARDTHSLSKLNNYSMVYEDIFKVLESEYCGGAKFGLFQVSMKHSHAFYEGFRIFYTDIWNASGPNANINLPEAIKYFITMQVKDYSLNYIDEFVEGEYEYVCGNSRDLYSRVARICPSLNLQTWSSYNLVGRTGTCVLFRGESLVLFSLTNKSELILLNLLDWSEDELIESVKILKKYIGKPINSVYVECNYNDKSRVKVNGRVIGNGKSRYLMSNYVRMINMGGTNDETMYNLRE